MGLSTYYVSQFRGFSDPPPPPRQPSSVIGRPPSKNVFKGEKKHFLLTLWRPFACFGQKSTCEVLRHVVQEGVPAKSIQYSYLVFSSKPGKAGSILPKDLRKLSLLQTDHKILTGVLAARLRKTEAYTLSVHQYAAGPRKIQHAITQARDLISNI